MATAKSSIGGSVSYDSSQAGYTTVRTGENEYMNVLNSSPMPPTWTDPNANPWNQTQAQTGATATQLQNSGDQVVGQARSAAGNYQGDPSAYPAFTNDYGLGKKEEQKADNTFLRNFNPWSLQGEANSR
jgi:hypothetical protein